MVLYPNNFTDKLYRVYDLWRIGPDAIFQRERKEIGADGLVIDQAKAAWTNLQSNCRWGFAVAGLTSAALFSLSVLKNPSTAEVRMVLRVAVGVAAVFALFAKASADRCGQVFKMAQGSNPDSNNVASAAASGGGQRDTSLKAVLDYVEKTIKDGSSMSPYTSSSCSVDWSQVSQETIDQVRQATPKDQQYQYLMSAATSSVKGPAVLFFDYVRLERLSFDVNNLIREAESAVVPFKEVLSGYFYRDLEVLSKNPQNSVEGQKWARSAIDVFEKQLPKNAVLNKSHQVCQQYLYIDLFENPQFEPLEQDVRNEFTKIVVNQSVPYWLKDSIIAYCKASEKVSPADVQRILSEVGCLSDESQKFFKQYSAEDIIGMAQQQ